MLRGTITFVGDADVTQKELRAALKPELEEVGKFWHDRLFPGHFRTGAAGKYKYAPRSFKHSERKRKRFGHSLPLVFTGDLREQVTRMAKISSTAKGARVTLVGPKYLYMYRKSYGQPDKAAELTAVTKLEVRAMARLLDRRLTKRLNEVKQSRTVKI